jgi:hypothetical protein
VKSAEPAYEFSSNCVLQVRICLSSKRINAVPALCKIMDCDD